MPPPHHSHAAAFHGGRVWLFGGVDALGSPAATLYRLPLQAPDAPALPKFALSSYQGICSSPSCCEDVKFALFGGLLWIPWQGIKSWLFGGVDALGLLAATLHRLPLPAPAAPALP